MQSGNGARKSTGAPCQRWKTTGIVLMPGVMCWRVRVVVADDLVVREAGQQLGQHDPRFAPGEVRAEAEVLGEPEREVRRVGCRA